MDMGLLPAVWLEVRCVPPLMDGAVSFRHLHCRTLVGQVSSHAMTHTCAPVAVMLFRERSTAVTVAF